VRGDGAEADEHGEHPFRGSYAFPRRLASPRPVSLRARERDGTIPASRARLRSRISCDAANPGGRPIPQATAISSVTPQTDSSALGVVPACALRAASRSPARCFLDRSIDPVPVNGRKKNQESIA
jgi:hypothetical protein